MTTALDIFVGFALVVGVVTICGWCIAVVRTLL